MPSPEYIFAALSNRLIHKEREGHAFRGNQYTGGIQGSGRGLLTGVLNSVERVGIAGRSELSTTPENDTTIEEPREMREHNLPKLQAKIATMNRKAKKLGVPEARLTVSEPYLVPDALRADGHNFKDGDIRTYTSFVKVSVDTPVIKLNGWRVVASVVLDAPEGEPQVVRTVPGEVSDPAWTYTTDKCDQCHIPSKGRKKIVMLKNDDGRTAQVGSSCLKDFTGHDANALLYWADHDPRESIIMLDNSLDNTAKPTPVYTTADILAVAATIIRRRGYVSVSAAGIGNTSTKVRINEWFNAANKGLHEEEGIEDNSGKLAERILPEDYETANAALEWAKSLQIDGNPNDYLRNLAVLASRPNATWRDVGYLSSLITAHKKSLEEAPVAAAVASVSAPKTEVPLTGVREFFTGTVLGYKTVDTGYGLTTKVRFLDDRGFTLWGTDPKAGENIGDRITFEAKVTGVSDSDPTFGFFQRPSKAKDLPAQ